MTDPHAIAGDPAAAKQRLRAAFMARRDAIAASEREAAALALAGHHADLPIAPGTVASAYWPIRSELDPRPLMQALFGRGVVTVLPTIPDRDTLGFREWTPGGALVAGKFGTHEPPAEAAERAPDVLLVPLLAFTRSGDRLGYGAGHFDRALQRLASRGVTAIGLAFAAQETAELPVEPHDQPMAAVLTEHGLIDCRPERNRACG